MVLKRCVILCSGPSVHEHDLSKVDCTIIGINQSYLARRSDIHVFTNGKLMKEKREEILQATANVALRFNASPKFPMEGCITPKKIQHLNRNTHEAGESLVVLPLDYDIHRDGWIFCGGAPCALQVAVSEGYDEIVFVGLDLHLEKGHHFYAEEMAKRRMRVAAFGAVIQMDFFTRFKPQLDRRGISVINTSLDSALDVFEQRPFDTLWR